MLFKEVVGQAAAKEKLIRLFKTGKLPHALLIVAAEGLGGLPLALAFAQYIFCDNKTNDDACGRCNACAKTSKLMHPDLHLSYPTVAIKPKAKPNSKSLIEEFRAFVAQMPYGSTFDWLKMLQVDNKQANITADECREIINELSLTSFEGGYKIQIIWRPEFLGAEGNILLKLIEEPPANTLIFLVAESTESILNTILSRTQQLMLGPISHQEIIEALVQRHGLSDGKARQVAHLSEHNYYKALNLLRAPETELFPLLRNWFNGIFTANGRILVQWVDDVARGGREEQKHFLLYVQHILGQAFRATLIPEYPIPLEGDELEFARKLSRLGIAPPQYEAMIEAISTTIQHIERNAHSKTQLLFLSIKMQYLIKGAQWPVSVS